MADGPQTNSAKILLVGDIENAFLDSPAGQGLSCTICDGMCGAIETSASEQFDVIGVVIPAQPAGISSALRALRQASKDSKIILLSQMYQEPMAIGLVQASPDGTKLADDYLICPVMTSQFYTFIEKGGSHTTANLKQTVIDNKTTARIKELERLATEDDLTGLKNRRYIWEFARQIIEHARQQNGQVTLLIFDIDDFKHYNDMYGHMAGDEILGQASALMRRCCRSHDVVGRIGGDEFAVVFWEDPQRKSDDSAAERRSAAEHPKEAVFISERFREQLENTQFNLLGPAGKGVLTISGGLATFPRDGSTAEELFRKADQALLGAKRSGKNRIYLVGTPGAEPANHE